MQLPAITLQVALASTVVAHCVSPTGAPRGASRLGSAQHHGRRALVARVAKLADASHVFAATTVKGAASTAVPPPVERLFSSLCEEDCVLKSIGALHHHLLTGKGPQAHREDVKGHHIVETTGAQFQLKSLELRDIITNTPGLFEC